MSSDVLNNSVLVLNRGWTPIHIKSAKDAICDVVAECATVIDTEDDYLMMQLGSGQISSLRMRKY
jgi:hypothetical protein